MNYGIQKIDKTLVECIKIIVTKILVSYAMDKMDNIDSLITKEGKQSLLKSLTAEKSRYKTAIVDDIYILKNFRKDNDVSMMVNVTIKTSTNEKRLKEELLIISMGKSLSSNDKITHRCSSCGSIVDLTDNGICEYCNTVYNDALDGWYVSSVSVVPFMQRKIYNEQNPERKEYWRKKWTKEYFMMLLTILILSIPFMGLLIYGLRFFSTNEGKVVLLIYCSPFIIASVVYTFIIRKKKARLAKIKFLRGTIKRDKIKRSVVINDYKKLEKDVFEVYKKVQESKYNIDLKTLRENTTDFIYKRFVLEMDQIRKDGNKRIIKDITLDNLTFGGRYKNSKGETGIEVGLAVRQIDYTIDLQTGDVLFGENKKKIVRYYNLQFLAKDIEDARKCNNCAASIDDVEKEECPYCKARLPEIEYRWIMDETHDDFVPYV